jgi:hypothetical protein
LEFVEESVKINFAHIIALGNALNAIFEFRMAPTLAYLFKKNAIAVQKEIDSIDLSRQQFLKSDDDEETRNQKFAEYINNTETNLKVYKIKTSDLLSEKEIKLSVYELKVLEPLLNDAT